MTTYATAERARQKAIAALRAAGLTAEAVRLAALPPITDRKTAKAAAKAEADRLRTKLDATEARLVEAEATIARLREAVNNHGQCSCRYTPGFPRGSRHASDCDYDPYLLAALTPEADR